MTEQFFAGGLVGVFLGVIGVALWIKLEEYWEEQALIKREIKRLLEDILDDDDMPTGYFARIDTLLSKLKS